MALSYSGGFSCKMAVVVLMWMLAISAASDVAFGASKFDDVIQPSWATDHVIYEGDLLKLKLDNFSGAGFASKNKYLYGKASADIKLVPGDSAGTVTAFYMSSEGDNHNEFDFEFLGNTTGEPYLVQTNLYINGVGNREQRMDLWFDPTTDFHSYSVHWTPRHVAFLVDDTPIRVYENKEDKGIAFPRDQPMGVYSSIWNADDWATQGGRVKTDWTHAPFVTTYRAVRIDGCEATAASGGCVGTEELLNVHQSHQLIWARANHLVYDYCVDTDRFPAVPPECARR
ncbi:xyloglucan endotransglucosylase protein 6 [Typha angustifolia]|uniref:xyloglucan endotransglucosylase protein 6 n=1 Tax=Typha angustifolia TaxID=59011 RepID=UPI003C2F3E6E